MLVEKGTYYVYRHIRLDKGLEHCKTITNQKPKKRIGNSKKVKNTETNETYNSIKDLAEILGLHPSTLRRKIKQQKINYTYL